MEDLSRKSLTELAEIMEAVHQELVGRGLHLRPTLLTQADDIRAVHELRRGMSRIRGNPKPLPARQPVDYWGRPVSCPDT